MGMENQGEQGPGKHEVIYELMEDLRSKSPMVDLAQRFGLLDRRGRGQMESKLKVLIDDISAMTPSTANEVSRILEDSDEVKLYKELQAALER